ncbi:radical SAM protein [Olavius sp. associated proteobacterium Delta 1]|nr:radical SAM protein [Olavius sp. associated proteobacterium Delta 1]
MNRDTPHILLINPWIHDFAAYDFWAKPMGLLTIAGLLRAHGVTVSYIDCLNRFHPRSAKSDPLARYGRGPYLKTRLSKPEGLQDVTRHYSRYGIKPHWLKADLLKLTQPDLVLVTSLMTYWYPGVQETIENIRSVFPQTPIVLGGIYARLCHNHARNHSGADHVAVEPAENNLFPLVQKFTGFSASLAFDPADLDSYPYPALDLQTTINYVPLLTTRGCPFDCAYCASRFLEPQRRLRSPESVIEEIKFWHRNYSISDFVLYDDAFLVDAARHAIPILEGICSSDLKVRFHTPNALHIRGINATTARLMYRAGFSTLRLGLETAEFDHRQDLDQKVSEKEFKRAVDCLIKTGFNKDQVGAYLLVGLPDQKISAVEQSIITVIDSDIKPVPAYYTPIPHTALWTKAVAASRYDITDDPVFTNNAIMPCSKAPFSWEMLTRLKESAENSIR